jgi:hypothetical protein
MLAAPTMPHATIRDAETIVDDCHARGAAGDRRLLKGPLGIHLDLPECPPTTPRASARRDRLPLSVVERSERQRRPTPPGLERSERQRRPYPVVVERRRASAGVETCPNLPADRPTARPQGTAREDFSTDSV